MSFFKDFKDDFSQAVNELMSVEPLPEENDMVVNTLEREVDARTELEKLDGLLEKVNQPRQASTAQQRASAPEKPAAKEPVAEKPAAKMEPVAERPAAKMEPVAERPAAKMEPTVEKPVAKMEPVAEGPAARMEPVAEAQKDAGSRWDSIVASVEKEVNQPVFEEARQPIWEPQKEAEEEKAEVEDKKEDISMSADEIRETMATAEGTTAMPKEVSDETAIITEGTTITGNLQSTGSVEVRGKVAGNVECNGKLTVTGTVKGNSNAAEFFADAAKIEGEISTDGTVKIGLGSVVVGNITATSAVIAGAIKGDIDVQGPVVVDTSAVVMGNIKSRSVQINNGAVIEGFCSQCYAEVDVNKLFD